jgi:CheY-like chemotaxis protein
VTDPKEGKGQSSNRRVDPRRDPDVESASPPPPGIRFMGKDEPRRLTMRPDPTMDASRSRPDSSPTKPEHPKLTIDPFADEHMGPTQPDFVSPIDRDVLLSHIEGEPDMIIAQRAPSPAAFGGQTQRRERVDPPTQPIDLAGYHESPLPLPAFNAPPARTISAPDLGSRSGEAVPPMDVSRSRPVQSRPTRNEDALREVADLPAQASDPWAAQNMRTEPLPTVDRRSSSPLIAPVLPKPPEPLPTADRRPSSPLIAPVLPRVPIAPPAAPQLPPPTSIQVDLPANVLVVDDDARAGSLIASRLLEHGYACRVVRLADAADALKAQKYDAAVLEVPTSDALHDHGAERLRGLGGFKGAVVITSPAVVNLDRLRGARVGAVLTKPFFADVLVQSIEAARTFEAPLERASQELERPRDEPPPKEEQRREPDRKAEEKKPAPSRGRDRRANIRHEFDNSIVRVVLNSGAEGKEARGRIRNMSASGGVMVETTTRYAARAQMTAEFTLLDSRRMIFTGRVVRSTASDLALKLDVDDAQVEFLDRFIEEASSSDQKSMQPVLVGLRVEGMTADIIDDMSLMKMWLEVSESIDDDALQQQFIQHCLKAEKLEFAVARYRELKAQRPDDERVAKYLQQIGTILGFYALSKKEPSRETTKLPSSFKLILVLLLLAGLAIVTALKHFMKG